VLAIYLRRCKTQHVLNKLGPRMSVQLTSLIAWSLAMMLNRTSGFWSLSSWPTNMTNRVVTTSVNNTTSMFKSVSSLQPRLAHYTARRSDQQAKRILILSPLSWLILEAGYPSQPHGPRHPQCAVTCSSSGKSWLMVWSLPSTQARSLITRASAERTCSDWSITNCFTHGRMRDSTCSIQEATTDRHYDV
jgi:hypothetical protein